MLVRGSLRPKAFHIAVAAALIAALLAAQTADAATFKRDRVQVIFSSSFAKVLKRAHARVVASGGATRSGRTVNLPIRGGRATMSPPITGSLSLTGTVSFKARRRTARLRRLSEALAGSRASVKSGRVALFNHRTRGKVAASSDFTTLSATGMGATLTRAAARTLNRKLRTRAFKRGQRSRVGRSYPPACRSRHARSTEPEPAGGRVQLPSHGYQARHAVVLRHD